MISYSAPLFSFVYIDSLESKVSYTTLQLYSSSNFVSISGSIYSPALNTLSVFFDPEIPVMIVNISTTTIRSATILFIAPLCAAGISFATTSIMMITRITIVESALIVGFVRFVMLYTTMEMFSTPLPVTKYDITKSSKDIVKLRRIPA